MKLIFIILLFGVGIFLIGFGITLWFVIPMIVKNKINDLLVLQHKTVVYQQWQNTTMPIFMQFWYFNVTNVIDVVNGSKPYVVECGPYTYREYRIKENIVFYDNGTVSYKQRRLFFFDRGRSVGDENDIITTVNIPLVVIGNYIRKFGILEKVIDFIVKKLGDGNVLMNFSVKNITWGYVDPVLEIAATFAKLLNITIDPVIGLFYKKNNTFDGEYLVDSGSISLDNFLAVRKWNNNSTLSFWSSNVSNMINGSDGTMFAPFFTQQPSDRPLYTFQSDICRSIYATFSSKTMVRGIPSWVYTPPDSVFANSSVNPYNRGFCIDGVCLGSGVLNLSTCLGSSAMPVVSSQPHLYQAAQKYQDDILGLRPSTDCLTTLTIEPTTGLPIDLQKKLQINIAVSPVAGFVHMTKIRSMLLPVMWLNESVVIDDSNAALITAMLIKPVQAATGTSIALMTLGLLFVVALSIGFLIASVKKHRQSNPINYTEIDS